MNRFGLRTTRLSMCFAIVALFLLRWGAPAFAQVTIIPYQDTGYKYMVVPHGSGSGFEQPGFDDSAWPIGDAAFGEINGFSCPLNNTIATDWPINTDILVRKHFVVPAGAMNVAVSVAIDNDIEVFVNGNDISSGVNRHEGCATRGSFVFSVDPSFLTSPGNVLAARGIDRGGADLLDLQVTANIAGACSLSPFNGGLTIDPDAGVFYLNGGFTVSGGCNIDPRTQEVTFSVGNYAVTLPAGSFVRYNPGYMYRKTVNGIFLAVSINFTSTPSRYVLLVNGSGVTPATTSPVPVTLTIGDNSGSADMNATFF